MRLFRAEQLAEFVRSVRAASRTQRVPALLGIDAGTKSIGLAFCDNFWRLAVSTTAVEVGLDGLHARHIALICRERSIGGIVVGYPYTLSGGTSHQCGIVSDFVDRLRESSPETFGTICSEVQPDADSRGLVTSCLLWDERFSSSTARALVGSPTKSTSTTKASRKKFFKKKKAVDSVGFLSKLCRSLIHLSSSL
mmetsp:Transcript_2039/g.4507  ORF Transcript_2039/g.4507 Transcript_2039/m.4507 type:complete len:195 (+) Transcript_2039:29-613(+)